MKDWFNCIVTRHGPFQKHTTIKLNDVLGSIDDKFETLDTLSFIERTFTTGTGE